MSEAQFNKAVKIIQELPKDGPVKPSTDDQLFVRATSIISFPR
jgi:diazepam-binding inhibitor (GABA receptor modulator, acyl-CoA-binding protein)